MDAWHVKHTIKLFQQAQKSYYKSYAHCMYILAGLAWFAFAEEKKNLSIPIFYFYLKDIQIL